MKLSKNFVKDYVDIDVDVKTLAEDMTRVGNEYDEAGKLINATNLVIGEVLTCEAHPDSDHLHVCTVDVGKETLEGYDKRARIKWNDMFSIRNWNRKQVPNRRR